MRQEGRNDKRANRAKGGSESEKLEAGTVVLAGFHAVAARLQLDPASIELVYVDPERRDKRMREMREKLFAAGVRVMNADARRLTG